MSPCNSTLRKSHQTYQKHWNPETYRNTWTEDRAWNYRGVSFHIKIGPLRRTNTPRKHTWSTEPLRICLNPNPSRNEKKIWDYTKSPNFALNHGDSKLKKRCRSSFAGKKSIIWKKDNWNWVMIQGFDSGKWNWWVKWGISAWESERVEESNKQSLESEENQEQP